MCDRNDWDEFEWESETPTPPPLEKSAETEADGGDKLLDLYGSIYRLRQDMDRIRKPLGTREHPTRTCRDLHFGHPQLKDGI